MPASFNGETRRVASLHRAGLGPGRGPCPHWLPTPAAPPAGQVAIAALVQQILAAKAADAAVDPAALEAAVDAAVAALYGVVLPGAGGQG